MKKSTQRRGLAAPVAIGRIERGSKPKMSGANDGIRVSHRELCGAVNTSAGPAFAVTDTSVATPGYDINPGNSVMFPWLSNIAQNFEQYRFEKLSFSLVSSQPSTAAGRYYMSLDYDWDDPVPSDVQTMMSNQTKLSCNVWQSASLVADTRSLHRDLPFKYCLSAKRADPEPRTVYSGFLTIAAQGHAAITTFDLWIDYVIVFKTPQLDTTDFFVDSSALTAVTNLTAAGTADFSNSLPVAPSPFDLGFYGVRKEVAGVGSTPAMAYNGRNVGDVFDIERFYGDQFSCKVVYNETAVTPANNLLKGPELRGALYSAAGALLGLVSSVAGEYFTNRFGPLDPTNVNTASASLVGSTHFHTHALRALYPTMKYFVPILYSAAAVGAGNAVASFLGIV